MNCANGTMAKRPKLGLAEGQRNAQKPILDLEFRQNVIAGLKYLQQVPRLRSDTVYQQYIDAGMIASRELYCFERNATKAIQEELTLLNGTHSPTLQRARSLLEHLRNLTNQTIADRVDIEQFPLFTLASIERINFTLRWKPINHSSILTNHSNVVEMVIHGVFDFGESVVKDTTDLGKTILHEGADLITTGFDEDAGLFSVLSKRHT